MEWPESFLNWPVGIYLLIVIGAQILPPLVIKLRQLRIERRRAKEGLPPRNLIMDHVERLAQVRWESGLQAAVLLLAVFVAPLLIVWVGQLWGADLNENVKSGLLAVFIAILVWLLVEGTDVAKAFLGGLAFKTVVAFQRSIQVGDRVTLKGYGGKVLKIGTFFITLQTPDDDLINIPSRELWSEVLVSANAGERSSLCVMDFYLAPFATKQERQRAEDTVWDAIQASPYCETAKPMQIYLSQGPDTICLTAKAYVTSTYDEPLFKSDVTRAFLDIAADTGIPLTEGQWKMYPDSNQYRAARQAEETG
jgi:hypothetical protein